MKLKRLKKIKKEKASKGEKRKKCTGSAKAHVPTRYHQFSTGLPLTERPCQIGWIIF